jgi:hypothetical protein
MTPKEKSRELVDTFYKEVKFIDRAKQCALIAVDGILNGSRLFYIEDYNYWQEVKQEIEKL